MSTDILAWIDKPSRPLPMPPQELTARARAEGVWDDFLRAMAQAQYVGAEKALQRIALPAWLAQIVREQAPNP